MGDYAGTPPTFTTGQKTGVAAALNNLRDFARSFTDAFTAWTPALTASTTNPTNWTTSGSYLRSGKLVVARFKITAGATTTVGSGTYRVSLPANANHAASGDLEVGRVQLLDSSAGASILCDAILAAPGYVQIAYPTSFTGGAALAGHAAPWSWASGDFLRGQIVYEAA